MDFREDEARAASTNTSSTIEADTCAARVSTPATGYIYIILARIEDSRGFLSRAIRLDLELKCNPLNCQGNKLTRLACREDRSCRRPAAHTAATLWPCNRRTDKVFIRFERRLYWSCTAPSREKLRLNFAAETDIFFFPLLLRIRLCLLVCVYVLYPTDESSARLPRCSCENLRFWNLVS